MILQFEQKAYVWFPFYIFVFIVAPLSTKFMKQSHHFYMTDLYVMFFYLIDYIYLLGCFIFLFFYLFVFMNILVEVIYR